jgi:ribonuclease BN (tRNA processing enzyme)
MSESEGGSEEGCELGAIVATATFMRRAFVERRQRKMTTRVELHFLGSADAFGSGGRFQTCLYVSGLSDGFLIDCGASSLIALKRNGIDASRIAWVLLTHLHGDHFGGLPFLILDGQFSRRTLPLVITGPPGVASRVESAMEVSFPVPAD